MNAFESFGDFLQEWVDQPTWSGLPAIAVLLASAVGLSYLLAWGVNKLPPRGKVTVAVLSMSALTCLILFVDLPGRSTLPNDFFAKRPLLAGLVPAVLLIAAGYLAADASLERTRRDRRAKLRQRAYHSVSRWWEETQRGADFLRPPKSTLPQPEAFIDALDKAITEAAIWMGVMAAQSEDDESQSFLDLLVEFRYNLQTVLAKTHSPGALSTYMIAAGEALEQMRYATSDPGFSKLYSVQSYAAGPWSTITGDNAPGYGGFGSKDDEAGPGNDALHRTHGTLAEGAVLWLMSEVHGKHVEAKATAAIRDGKDPLDLMNQPSKAPSGHKTHLDWLASTYDGKNALIAARAAHADKRLKLLRDTAKKNAATKQQANKTSAVPPATRPAAKDPEA